jgi:hypothetical protein
MPPATPGICHRARGAKLAAAYAGASIRNGQWQLLPAAGSCRSAATTGRDRRGREEPRGTRALTEYQAGDLG